MVVLARPSRRIARGIHTWMGFHSRHGPQTCPAAHPIRTGEFHEAHHPPCPARAVFRQLPGCLQHGEGCRQGRAEGRPTGRRSRRRYRCDRSALTQRRSVLVAERERGRHCRPYRSEEHTSELQSLMSNSYAVFCFKKKKKTYRKTNYQTQTKRYLRLIK